MAGEQGERGWNWDRTIETIKVVGGLMAAVWALVQYGNQIEQARTENILHAVQVMHDVSAQSFQKNLHALIIPFYDPDYSKTKVFWDLKNKKKPSAAALSTFYQNTIFKPHDHQFEQVVAFFDQIYDFSATNSCTWKVVEDSLRQNARDFFYYFEPVFDEYAHRKRIDPQVLWKPVYAMVDPGTSESCRKSFAEGLASW